jgi:hypothetical protein
MPTIIGQHTVATFTSPVNGTTPIDANTVRGNDNTMRTAYNTHDTDPGIHVQSSTFASRPAAGTAGRKWITADAGVYKLWYDDGTRWHEVGNDHIEVDVIADEVLAKGDVVSVSGYNVGLNVIRVAKFTGTAPAFGIANEAIANGSRGYVVNTGIVTGIDTTGYGTSTEPSILYAAATTNFTATKPTSGFYQASAYLLRHNSTNGVLYVEFSAPRIVERSDNTASTIVLRDASGNFSAGAITATSFVGPVTGNASTATALQNARTLWGQSFDGTANVSGALTGVTDITASGTITAVTFAGALTGNASTATALQNTRTLWGQNFNGTANVSGALTGVTDITASGTITAATLVGALTGNASTATALQNVRTLWGQNFDGTANVTGNLTSVGNITGTAGVTLQATSAALALAATGANAITLATNGVDRLTVTGAGDVGVGTTSPTQPLHVSRTGGTNSTVLVQAVTGQASLRLLTGDGTTNRASRIDFLNGVSSTTTPRWILINDFNQLGDNDFRIVNAGNTSILTVLQSGNVGIGTTSPAVRLEVQSDSSVVYSASAASSPIAVFRNPNTTNGTSGAIQLTATGAGAVGFVQMAAIQTASGSAAFAIGTRNAEVYAERLRITSAGNVGIGTASPTAPLHVSSTPQSGGASSLVLGNAQVGSGSFSLNYTSTAFSFGGVGGSESLLLAADSGPLSVATWASNPIKFITNQAERARITAGGDLSLIGGTFFTDFIGEYAGGSTPLTIGTTGNRDVVLRANNVERARITAAGNVGIGTTAPGALLDVDPPTTTPAMAMTRTSRVYLFRGRLLNSGQSLRVTNITNVVGRASAMFYCKISANRITSNADGDHWYAIFAFRVFMQGSGGGATIQGLTSIAEYGISVSTAVTFVDVGSGEWYFQIASPGGNTTPVSLEMEVLHGETANVHLFSDTFTATVV